MYLVSDNLDTIFLPEVAAKVRSLLPPTLAFSPELVALSASEDADIDVPTALPLLPFQRGGVAYTLQAKRTIIGDEMGLGKTVQALGVFAVARPFPALVVCPPSLALNWRNEINRFLPEAKVEVLKGTKPVLPNVADIYVIGDAVLPAWAAMLTTMNLRALVVDEAHRFKTPDAQRTRALYQLRYKSDKADSYKKGELIKGHKKGELAGPVGLAERIPANGFVLLLTGTTIVNRPVELMAQLNIVGRLPEVVGARPDKADVKYLFRYCGAEKIWAGKSQGEKWVFKGASNLGELHSRLRAVCYVRREKADVLAELPPKRRSRVVLDLNGAASMREYKRAEKEFLAWLHDTKGAEKAASASKAEELAKMGALKRLIGLAKVDATIEFVQDLLDQDQQVVVFAHHRDVVKAIAEHFNAPTVMGGDKVEKVEEGKRAFQAGEAKVIVLNITAGGMGHTLTAASNVVFAELNWTPGEHVQAEDRCHRIGQVDSVNAHYLLATETIDETLYDIIEEKRIVTQAVNAGKEEAVIMAEDDQIKTSEGVQAALLGYYKGKAA